jgi:hypothetical protein
LDIDGWLGRIGLAQYAEMFRANDIDGELLGRLTNDDLKDIGVASFGHRKKLLEAIAELGGAPAATHAPRPVVAPSRWRRSIAARCRRWWRSFLQRHKSMDVLRTYVRDAELFRNHADDGLL